ncbi:MAG: beta-methylgalactoside transporter [Clostridia bacterium]
MQTQPISKKSTFSGISILHWFRDNIIIVGIMLVAVIVGILRPNFISEANFRNLLSNTAIRFIIAVGVSGCLITKGTDLSAGRMAGLAACISAIFLQRGDYASKFYPEMGEPNILLVLLMVLAICAVFGMINGSVIAFFKVPPFIATLGMQTLIYGICLVYTGASPIGGLRADYSNLATGFIGNQIFSYTAIIALIIGVLMWFLYNKTRHGKYMYAIGGNESAAEVAGVNCNKTKILIYMLAAVLYGICGFLMTAKSGGASVNTAMGYELEAIAGCTIGGVSVNGGVGKISGILIGVLVFELLKIAMQFMGIETSYTYIVQGLVIIVAVALDLRKYLAKK